jgi:hypothetical protein
MNASRYPKFNDHPTDRPPILSVFGQTPLGELVWLIIPIAALVLAWLLR